ncbi:metallophosphoesterase [Cupriavidus gilardii]|uniref:metallophosphoesterase n=1 Tax=Cupriavidus gilardii TaxID=82541 RepID=UPI00157260A0|nr:metallophosphoesterase [Cupriavidus gilardii]NSX06879.1 metallophosphoesterase family protein [Cupriavidus gilardii]
MKLRVLSDLHLEHHTPESVPDCDADLVVLAGDIANGRHGIDWAARHLRGPIVYVPGNHEYYDSTFTRVDAQMAAAAAAHRQVHLLTGGVAVFELPDQTPVRVLGTTWWADYALFGRERIDDAMQACAKVMLDHRLISVEDDAADDEGGEHGAVRRFTPADALARHRAESAWLASELDKPFDGATVVVTHHAPDLGSLDPRYAHDLASAGFISRRPDLVQRADLWIHGHTHTSFDYRVDRARVVCNPRGYVRRGDGALENPKFDWGYVVEV